MSSDGQEMLKSAMAGKPWKRVVDNKMRGLYGETDFDKRRIRINKRNSKKKPMYKRPVTKGAKKYPDVLGTIVHEEYHRKHEGATEKTTYRKERQIVRNLTPEQKKRFYRLYPNKKKRTRRRK